MALKKESEGTYHFRENMSKHVILHHNPKIIRRIAEHLEAAKEVENKNFLILSGIYADKEITLIATGMGAGSTGIVVDQSIMQGAEYIFKFGTFGALQDDIRIGDILMPSGAVRSEGLTDAYAPLYYPAVPDGGLLRKVYDKADSLGIDLGSGIVHSVNVYDPYMNEPFSPEKYSPDTYRKVGVKGVEMETSSVFVCSSVKGARSVALLVCNRDWETIDSFRQGREVDWDKHQDEKRKDEATTNCIRIMLETIKDL